MASSPSLDERKISSLDLSEPEIYALPAYRRLSILNGLLVGLAISVGFWALKVYAISKLPTAIEIDLGGVIASSMLIIILCTLISWLTARLNKIWLTAVAWLVISGLITLVLGYIPTYGRNLAVWLIDTRFSGIYVYTVPQVNEWWSFIVAGLGLIFILLVLAILQSFRLERAYNELNLNGSLSRRAFFTLLIPALFAVFGAYIMPDHLGSGPRSALAITYEGIQVVQEFEGTDGELFDLTKETGFNYSALKGVRDQLNGPYDLMVGELDARTSQVIITTHFDNGAWINCRVNAYAGQATYLSFCADASRPYTAGFASLITGQPLPENCFGCLPQADPEWQTWLQERSAQFDEAIQFDRIAQQGNTVWMQASDPAGAYALECMFTGIVAVQLQECQEVKE